MQQDHALLLHIDSGDAEATKEQIKRIIGSKLGIDAIVDSEGNTALLRAARCGHTNLLRILINNKANINLRNREEWNALHFAAFRNRVETAEYLLKQRINIFAFNSSGINPLHIASMEGHSEMISILLRYGADINEISKAGWASLHLAASNNNTNVCQTLINAHADPNAIKMPHGTPLHLAAREGHWKTCIALVNGGSLVDARDKLGRRPVDVAKDFPRVIKILKSAEEVDFSRRMISVISQAEEVMVDREEAYLNSLEEQLFSDMNQYINESSGKRISMIQQRETIDKSNRLSTLELEEKRFSKSVRVKSVIPKLAATTSLVTPLEAWRGSGLHILNQGEETEENEYLCRNKADCVLMAFGNFPGNEGAVENGAVAFPGSTKVIQSSNMLWSWLARVAGAVVDKQAQESMEHILRLLNTLFNDGADTKSVKSLLSLTALILYHNNTHLRSEAVLNSNNTIDMSIHYFKFSCAAYGWKMLNPLMFSNKRKAVLLQGFMTGDMMNNKALCEHTGISDGDIITTKWTSSDYHPAHYIAIDHSTRSIVLAIRGSFHVKDALVDLVAAATPFQGGYAHTGMLECARRKLVMVRIPLLQSIVKYPTYSVVIIGHSLGAGTAALLTLLLKDEIPCSTPLRCFAYAPPCVLSPQLAKSSESLISSFVLGNDCVPRLSYASIAKLKNLTAVLMEQGSSGVSVLLKAKRGQINIPKLNQEIEFNLDTALLPPGQCYHILCEDDLETPAEWIDRSLLRKCYRVEQSCPTLFTEVVVCSTMFSDHVPWNYQNAFAGVQLRQTLFNQHQKSKPLQ